MSKRDDLIAFYALMDELERRIGGKRLLSDADGRMTWPDKGVYFFFEPGEDRSCSGQGPRVVRVGTHGLIASSRSSLRQRLRQHRGTLNPPGGNHRGSVFRRLVGNALTGRDPRIGIDSWGTKKVEDTRRARHAERPLEEMVSRRIGGMSVAFVPIEDGPDSERRYVERNAIALLSGFPDGASDPPSPNWLGRHCDREKVRLSGLWNNNHVDGVHESGFLSVFERLVDAADSDRFRFVQGRKAAGAT